MDQPRRILIVRPSALGDVAKSVAALVSLKHAYPDAAIDWLVRDSLVDVIAHHPMLNEPVVFHRNQIDKAITLWWSIHRRRYDRVYDLQGLIRSGLYTWATRAPHRVGMRRTHEPLAWLGYNRRVEVRNPLHMVDALLALLEADGVTAVRDMTLYVGEADRQWAATYLATHGLAAERFAVIAPTARGKRITRSSKGWPIQRYAAVADRLIEVGFEACVVVGTAAERGQVAPLIDDAHAKGRRLDLVGGTTVGRLMAIIERCGLLLANDSAALHIARGLGRRAVGIFGPTDPAQVGPYRYDAAVVRAEPGSLVECDSQRWTPGAITAVTIEQLWAGVQRILRQPPPVTVLDPEPSAKAE